MKLRIVTATRGESPYWSEMMASVGAVSGVYEHVVVCPAEKRAALAGAHRGLAIVPERGVGLYAAINQALREPGEWDAFTWINDDDVLRSPGFGRLLAWLEANPAADIAYGRADLINGQGERVADLSIARRTSDLAALFARGIIPLAQPGTVIRRKTYEQLGGIDANYRLVGDMDFFVRAVSAGAKFGFVHEHVASFRLTAGQLSKQGNEVAAETERALQSLRAQSHPAGAVLRFRLANLGVYLDRIRRHGFVSTRELYNAVE